MSDPTNPTRTIARLAIADYRAKQAAEQLEQRARLAAQLEAWQRDAWRAVERQAPS